MRVSVVCIGNELLMDEGVGPACARYLLSRYEFPEEASVLDRACMGMAIISDLRECDRMLVLDAVDVPGAQPGNLFTFAPEDVATTPAGMTSLHDVRFADVLGSAELLGIRCEGHCMGIQVENMSPSEFVAALTPRVANALPLLAQAAVRFLRDAWGLNIVDRAVRDDSLRAGLPVAGARNFSYAGARGACDGDATQCVGLALPAVYGEPDAAPMACYMAQGLAAVGAEGMECVEYGEAPGGRHAVSLWLPGATVEQRRRADSIAERFGLEALACDSPDTLGRDDGAVGLLAWVSPQITDYDCDALIGACLDAIEAGEEER